MDGSSWIRVGAVFGFLAVSLGAFGAHGLKEKLAEMGTAANYQTAVEYHFYHTIALLAVGLLATLGRQGTALTVAGWGFTIGTLIFSGTLYALSLTGLRWLGAITPIGGVALLVGWAALAVAAGSSRG